MNIALKIQKQLNKKADLKLIKKIISLYEEFKNEDDYMNASEAIEYINNKLGDISISEKIKAYRQRENITQKELANKTEIKQQHISEIERGIRQVGVITAKKLAIALNCDYRQLL